ncbi:MAG: SDR family oxidoreductase [Terriglobia bacterium]
MRLSNKVSLITGSARGIACPLLCVLLKRELPLSLPMWTLCRTIAQSAVQRISPGSCFVRLDVTQRETVQQQVLEIHQKMGRIDILVNNAGITADAQLLKLSEPEWDRVIDTNLKGVLNCTQAVAPLMVEQGYGKIINAASISGIHGNFGQTNYAAAKAGVIAMTKVWARELGPKGIWVNALAPGFIETGMTSAVPQKIRERVVNQTPLGRMGKAVEVANAYVFLASDESSFIHGAVLQVDGGLVL